MKLNPDCTRAILLAVEKVCDIQHIFQFPEDKKEIVGDFSNEEIRYHLRQCSLSGLLYKCSQDLGGNFLVMDLSPAGHEFLANIREDGVWKKVKTISSNVGSKSLSALVQIAAAVVNQLIQSQLGLH